MKESLKKDMEESINLIMDSKYMRSVVPEVDNSASSTNNEEWVKEIAYSVENYNLENDISDEL